MSVFHVLNQHTLFGGSLCAGCCAQHFHRFHPSMTWIKASRADRARAQEPEAEHEKNSLTAATRQDATSWGPTVGPGLPAMQWTELTQKGLLPPKPHRNANQSTRSRLQMLVKLKRKNWNSQKSDKTRDLKAEAGSRNWYYGGPQGSWT